MPRVLLALTALTLLLASCGGDDDGGDETDATGNGGTATAAATSDGGNGNGGGNGDGTPEGEEVDLSEFFADIEDQEFIVTFDMQSEAQEGAFSGEWTWYRDPENERARFDISGEQAGQAFDGSIISSSERTLICFEGACLEVPTTGGGAGFPDPSAVLAGQVTSIEDVVGGSNVQDAGTRTIAGVEARCVEFEDEASSTTGITCVNQVGIPLLAEWESDGATFTLEATEYSDSVSDEDFEPPFPVTSVGG